MRRNLWGRLERLERDSEALHGVLTLPYGSRVLYTVDKALDAVGAAIRGGEAPLLGAFLEAETTEGLPGLCRALVGSRERVARGDTRG